MYWFISLSIKSSRYIHVVGCVRISFFFKAEEFSILCTSRFYLFIYGQILGCFELLAIMNNAAMYMGIEISVQAPTFNSLGYIIRSRIAESWELFNSFEQLPSTLSAIVTALFFFTLQCIRVPFSPHPVTLVTYYLFYTSHSNWYEVITHLGFDLHFPNDYWWWISFHVSVGHLSVFFGKMPIQVPIFIFKKFLISV